MCPFCEDFYPFPDNFDEIHKCRCGAVYTITWQYDIEDTMNQLAHFFLKNEEPLLNREENNLLFQAVVYEDIQDLISMKIEYEAFKYMRRVQSFDQNYPQKVGLIWLGNYQAKQHYF